MNIHMNKRVNIHFEYELEPYNFREFPKCLQMLCNVHMRKQEVLGNIVSTAD